MNTITNAYLNALLADASYVKNLTPGLSEKRLAEELGVRMTPIQAEWIATNFEVAASIETDDLSLPTESGFDAVIWRGRTGTEFEKQVFVSIRGTEGFQDFITDADLAANSAARRQICDMVNWWLTISTPEGQDVTLINYVRDLDPLSLQYFTVGDTVKGTGELADVTNVSVNGHSMGGHLASSFARIFGNQLTIDAVNTYNSVGFIPTSELVFANLELVLGTGSTEFRHSVQNNYWGEHGINMTTNDTWFDHVGQRQEVFMEENRIDLIANHSMYKLTDSKQMVAYY